MNVLISKYEIVDGKPFDNDIVPLRLFIGSFDLTPTFANINNYFSVKYFLKFLISDGDEKYFSKEQEIIFYRKNYKN